MEIGFSRALTSLRFQHRVTELPDGTLAYRLGDKSGFVRVSRNEWDEAGKFFADSTRDSARKAKALTLLSLPAFVAYIMIANVAVPKELALAMPQWLYLLLFIGPLPGMPIAIYLWHSHHVQRVSKAIDTILADHARMPEPTRPALARPPFWFDLLCLMFIGPHLMIAVIGELDPDFFRNTPFTGRHIDTKAIVAFGLLLVRILWEGLVRRQNQPPQASL